MNYFITISLWLFLLIALCIPVDTFSQKPLTNLPEAIGYSKTFKSGFNLAGLYRELGGRYKGSYAFDQALTAYESSKKIKGSSLKNEIQQKEKEKLLAIHDKEDKIVRIYRFAILALLVLVFFVLWLVYSRYQLQQKFKRDLEYHKRQMKENNEKLTNYIEDLQQFTRATSHDLKEPLRTIRSFTDLIKKRIPDDLHEETEDYFNFVEHAINNMKDLLDNLLTYATLEDKTKAMTSVDLNEIMQIVTDNLVSQIEDKHASILAEPLPMVTANREHMIQLFQNLISNGLKFNNDSQPEIIINCQNQNGDYKFAIRDNGIGIEKAYQEKVFQLFQKLNDSSQYMGGGLGLAICKKIIRQYEGKIWVNSEFKVGSTFYFTLPAESAN